MKTALLLTLLGTVCAQRDWERREERDGHNHNNERDSRGRRWRNWENKGGQEPSADNHWAHRGWGEEHKGDHRAQWLHAMRTHRCSKSCPEGQRCIAIGEMQVCVNKDKLSELRKNMTEGWREWRDNHFKKCDRECEQGSVCRMRGDEEVCVKRGESWRAKMRRHRQQMCEKVCPENLVCRMREGEQKCVERKEHEWWAWLRRNLKCDKECPSDFVCRFKDGEQMCVSTAEEHEMWGQHMEHARKEWDSDDDDDDDDDEDEEERRRRRRKAKGEKFTCYGWMNKVAQEIGFSTWFRVYVLYLLFCNLTFVTLLGYHFMMAAGYRMVVPPVSKTFFVSFTMLCTFFVSMTLFNTFIWLNIRLVVSWLGMTRESCNLFFLPNRYEDPVKAVRLRDYQLLLFELAVLVVPLVYSVVKVVTGGELATSVVGHFSFVSFVVFGILFAALWVYFWFRSIRAKSKAWRLGNKLLKEAKAAERYSDSESDESEESEEDEDDDSEEERRKKKKKKNKKRRGDDSSDDDDDDDRRKKRKKKNRRDDDSSEEEERRRKKKAKKRRKSGKSDSEKEQKPRVPWHRRKLANPLVMAEFGVDLFSIQAYVLHCIMGVIWLVVVSFPIGTADGAPVEWLAITAVALIGGLFMLRMGPSKKKAKKVANRQRHATLVMMTVWSLFMLVGVIAAFAASMTWAGLLLFVMLLMTQLLTVRRHDMHVREEGEPGAMFLPYTNHEKKENKRWIRWGRPAMWIPLIPCGDVFRVCFKRGCCMEPPVLNPNGGGYGELKATAPVTAVDGGADVDASGAGAGADGSPPPPAAVVVTMDMRDGRQDKIIRPAACPGYKLPGAESEYVKTAKGKTRLGREVYLNRRERVLMADAMVMTWYFAVYLIVLGVVYGFGDWLQPAPGLGTPTSGGTTPESSPYAVCMMPNLWQGHSIQDFAFLNYQTLLDADGQGAQGLTTWFPSARVANRSSMDATFIAERGHPVGWVHYSTGRGEVIVLYGDSPKKEWMRDVDTWGEAGLYQLLGALNPFFALWPQSNQEGFVKAAGYVKKGMEQQNPLAPVERYLQSVLTDGNTDRVYLSGHGPYGGWAKILWQKVKGGATSASAAKLEGVVAFAPPGTRWTGERLDAPALSTSNEVSLVPRRAALSLIDRQTGFVQETECDTANSITACQTMDVLLCELLKSCGDPDGRSYTGFTADGKCKL
eukprot:TRINITY_DN1723_c0_g1_i1.p1 TRINITY_DN1723_c0_g1~~TRINITY_DN1723_c0_g1_i1.p1  ORF type:complete len:1196 (+),score=384.64 TRINITY_DN1723_c0_g1_i1:39-3626(+)